MAIGIIIPRVTIIGDNKAISSFGIPYSTSLRDVAASVTANAAERERESVSREDKYERYCELDTYFGPHPTGNPQKKLQLPGLAARNPHKMTK